MHDGFMPPPKPDLLELRADSPPDVRRWLTAAIWMTLVLAGVCFACLLLVDRSYGWPAYAGVFAASVFTVIRDRVDPE